MCPTIPRGKNKNKRYLGVKTRLSPFSIRDLKDFIEKINPKLWLSDFTRDVGSAWSEGHDNLQLPTVNSAPSRVSGEAALSIREAQDSALPLICLQTPNSLKGGYPHTNHQLQVIRNSGQKELSPPQRKGSLVGQLLPDGLCPSLEGVCLEASTLETEAEGQTAGAKDGQALKSS